MDSTAGQPVVDSLVADDEGAEREVGAEGAQGEAETRRDTFACVVAGVTWRLREVEEGHQTVALDDADGQNCMAQRHMASPRLKISKWH